MVPPRRIAWPTADLGDVADPDRDPLDGLDDDAGDIVDRACQADPLDHDQLATPIDRPAADVLIVLPQAPNHVVERQPILGELGRIDPGLVLLGQPPQGVDLRDAGYPPQSRADDPFVQGPQIGQVERVAGEIVMVDLPQAGGDRPQRRTLDPGREPNSPSRSLICWRAK